MPTATIHRPAQPALPPASHAWDGIDAPPFIEPPPTIRERSAAQARNEVVDVVRLFAAAGVVFVHAVVSPELDRWGNFFRFAVPFYLFASLYFQSRSLRRKPERSLVRYAAERFTRLYFPFLAWSVIYLIARDVKHITMLGLGTIELSPSLLWKGTAYHLWFLPFLFAASIVLAVLHRTLIERDVRFRVPLIAVAIAGGIALGLAPPPAHWNEVFPSPTYAYVQYWRALPAALWAMAFAWAMTTGPVVYNVSSFVASGGIVLAIAFLYEQVVRGIGTIPRAFTGLGCMLAALAPWHGRAISLMARFGRYGYGIYLSHVLIVELIRAMLARFHFEPSPSIDLLNFAASFTLSILLVRTFERTRWLAWLNG